MKIAGCQEKWKVRCESNCFISMSLPLEAMKRFGNYVEVVVVQLAFKRLILATTNLEVPEKSSDWPCLGQVPALANQ